MTRLLSSGLTSILRACIGGFADQSPVRSAATASLFETLEGRQMLSASGGAETYALAAASDGVAMYAQARRPSSPARVSATAVSSSRIRLDWTNRSAARVIQVFQRRGAGEWKRLATVPATYVGYMARNLAPGATYSFRVRAVSSAGPSLLSKAVAARTLVPARPVAPPTDDSSTSSPVAYDAPITITRGGTYSGNWQSLSAGTPAVRIRTAEPVVIQNSYIRSRGTLIDADGGANITIRNTVGYGMNPNVRGRYAGRFLNAEGFKNVRVENNTLIGTSGIYLYGYVGNHTEQQTVKVLRNKALNIDGRYSNGTGGYLTGLRDHYYVQFFQSNELWGMRGAEVAWNQVINEPGKSRVEDNVSIYKTSGVAGNPFRIHNNYIKGAYSVNPAADRSYTGGGIMLSDQGSSWVEAYNNQVVSTTNYGIAISSGHDNKFYNNRIVSSGRLADGTVIPTQNVGAYIWDQNGEATFARNSGQNNLIGWQKGSGRNDYWVPDAAGWSGNSAMPGTITLATEANEWTLWQQKLGAAGLQVGAAGA